METNKLLTLEEIEKMDAGLEEFITDHPSVNEINVRLSAIKKALTTARAYWEEKEKESRIVDQWRYTIKNAEDFDDKPHLPTLKVIVEAMKGMLNQYHFANSNIECGDLATFTESLEKHLE